MISIPRMEVLNAPGMAKDSMSLDELREPAVRWTSCRKDILLPGRNFKGMNYHVEELLGGQAVMWTVILRTHCHEVKLGYVLIVLGMNCHVIQQLWVP